MTLRPATATDLGDSLRAAAASGTRVTGFDLRALSRVLEYRPEDMTVTAGAGITLAALQAELAAHNQWLPIDPPQGERLTVGALLATNASGPRRYGFGTIRDWLIGIKVVLADGRLIKSGGKVVKNVAGYDLAKLFIGSQGSLGVIVEATFKLRPRPETERFVQTRLESTTHVAERIARIFESEISPVVLDWHRRVLDGSDPSATVVLGFSGTGAEVEWQLAEAERLGIAGPGSLDHETTFWSAPARPSRRSVLPSALAETIGRLGDVPFVARAGNGVVFHHGGPPPEIDARPHRLAQRLKDEFDPQHILPDLPP